MTLQEQKWLVLLYSLIELDGGCARKQVLCHIQGQNYWYKNDQNDASRTSRNEKAWRNDFSYERIHLIENGSMQNRADGIWNITEPGKECFCFLAEKAGKIASRDDLCFTASFFQKLFHEQICPEEAADQLLLNQLFNSDGVSESACTLPPEGPLPKGPVSGSAGNRAVYLRNPAVSRRALSNAGYRCEVDANHPSFPRRNSSERYMEPHHLVPMSMTEFYNVSLDREQNIFSLCSNCHNQIHYGTKEDVRELISKLFSPRKDEIGLILGRTVTLEDLYEIYAVK
jgi:hypothetical protein